MRGGLIVFEGIDRSGKSTQSRAIASLLASSVQMSFPNRETIIASLIDSYLKSSVSLDDHAIHLLFSANRWECRQQIIDNIQRGTFVVLDRYAYSGIAYSAAKGLDINWCKEPEAGLPKPDLVVYMKLRPEEAKQRAEYGAERYERLEFQLKVAEQYENLLASLDYCLEVDAGLEVSVITEKILEKINSLDLNKPLGTLW